MSLRSIVMILALLAVQSLFQPPGTRTNAATRTPQASEIDLTHLPLGDGKLADRPTVGWIWPCRINPNAGGAFKDGPWIRSDGTYDLTAKAVVDGSVTWTQQFQVKRQGDSRIFVSNDLPNHLTGVYPIAQADDAYQYDRNPNRISEQTFQIELPANPTLAAQPSCLPGGAIGILLTGSFLFNALDAPGRDAVAHETQDGCQGHPEQTGAYHYHSLTTCLPDTTTSDGHAALVGYSFDGFGIYGRQGEGSKPLTSADLDECHGHTHQIEWDGKTVSMYHYHATWDFPYTLGCLRGTFYGIVASGNQAGPPGDGSGRPRGGNQGGGPRGQPDLAAAAKKLGVTEQALRDALGPPPPDLAAAAKKLGVSEQALRDALGVPGR